MGTSHWSNDFYRDRAEHRAATNANLFDYHAKTAAQPVHERKVHDLMNPKGVTRESRDSDAHPNSVAIAVILDETGSMQSTPVEMQKVLPKLMTTIIEGGTPDPQVLFGAVGDTSNHEAASVQIGQFESGLEMEDDLGRMFMEGKGGGSNHESYQNVIYFFARHTSIDCHEKRGRKGYLFIVGDELPYAKVSRTEVELLFGDMLQDDLDTKDVIAECAQKYEIYYVIPRHTHNGNDSSIYNAWVKLLGDGHVLKIQDATQICDVVSKVVNNDKTPAADATNERL
jgi:hypothetical protein